MRERCSKTNVSAEFNKYMHDLNESVLRHTQYENRSHVTVPKETFIPATESAQPRNGLHSRSESHCYSEIVTQQSLPFDSSLDVGTNPSISKNANRKRSLSVCGTSAVSNAKKK